MKKIEYHSPETLNDHPLLEHIPVWRRGDPEFLALTENILERGVDYPVLIDSMGRVVDGRNRRNACLLLGVETPCRRVADGEVASVIVAGLALRRHLAKGALAYLAAPLFEEVLEESKRRHLEFLRAGGKSRVHSVHSAPQTAEELETSPETALRAVSGDNVDYQGVTHLIHNGGKSVPHSVRNAPQTTEDIAAQLGVGRRTLMQALELRRRFAEDPHLREQFEPPVLAGEYGLGQAIQAIAGKTSTQGKPRREAALPTLLTRGFRDVQVRFRRWESLEAPERAGVMAACVRSTAGWPDEVVRAAAAAWKKEGRL